MLLCCYCGDTLLGVRDPTWPDFQSLLIPCFGYYSSDPSFLLLKEEFTLLSRAPNSLGSNSLAVSLLCVFMDTRIFLGILFSFGLVGIHIMTYFISRYAMYAIKSILFKSDFSIVLKIFIMNIFLKQKSLNPIFLSKHYIYHISLEILIEFDELHASKWKPCKRD